MVFPLGSINKSRSDSLLMEGRLVNRVDASFSNQRSRSTIETKLMYSPGFKMNSGIKKLSRRSAIFQFLS